MHSDDQLDCQQAGDSAPPQPDLSADEVDWVVTKVDLIRRCMK